MNLLIGILVVGAVILVGSVLLAAMSNAGEIAKLFGKAVAIWWSELMRASAEKFQGKSDD